MIGDAYTPDILAFLLIVFWARKSRVRGLKVSTVEHTIAEDVTCYFMVIFTSHFVLVMTLNLGQVSVAVPQFTRLQPMNTTVCIPR